MVERTGTILDEILAKKRQEVDARKARVAMDLIELKLSRTPPPRDFLGALRRAPGEPVRVIAELKRASPVKGILVQEYNPEQIAGEFARGGAAGLSVLTDESFFLGSLTHLPIARRGLDAVGSAIPLLRKDFIIDPYQVAEARAWGADACLLIVAALDDAMLATLHAAIRDYDMTALVEVNNAAELARAVAVGAALIGVNQRDLRNFSVNTDLAADLAAQMPQETVRVALSGIKNADDMRRLAAAGFDAALVGESVITAADRTAAVRALAEAGR
ncbi:MAG: indole-3-glycerol phosphate synthase TrpC [Candidatus Eremiobacteraeota bacterium]|nr:indole-3-glycerol phosphate synthase TrpC [Candidatus Eremiobacteraeota bacterium]